MLRTNRSHNVQTKIPIISVIYRSTHARTLDRISGVLWMAAKTMSSPMKYGTRTYTDGISSGVSFSRSNIPKSPFIQQDMASASEYVSRLIIGLKAC